MTLFPDPVETRPWGRVEVKKESFGSSATSVSLRYTSSTDYDDYGNSTGETCSSTDFSPDSGTSSSTSVTSSPTCSSDD